MIWPGHRAGQAVLGVVAFAVVAAGVAVAVLAPDPVVDDVIDSRAAYAAGWRHAENHQLHPDPSGLPPGPDGARAACQLWIDQTDRGLDRTSFLAGCDDATTSPETPR